MSDLDLIVMNDAGRRFGVRIVGKGDRYGLDDCLVYDETSPPHHGFRDGDPLVEFYDMTYADCPTNNAAGKFGPRGQFVSRYYASTLLGQDPWSSGQDHTVTGLDLDGGVDVWKLDPTAMKIVMRLVWKARREAVVDAG